MRANSKLLLALLMPLFFARPNVAQPQKAPAQPARALGTSDPAPKSQRQVVDRVIEREQEEIQLIRSSQPIVETYAQEMKIDQHEGLVPKRDAYFLGKADLKHGNSIVPMVEAHNPFGGQFVPEGFLQLVYVDSGGIDRRHYSFTYIGKEFLGEVRCLMFDVKPIGSHVYGRFVGRIWVEDQDFTIVRFNGIYEPLRWYMAGITVHFDSWRTNLKQNVWLPSYIYVEEVNRKVAFKVRASFKAQTRLWGYNVSPNPKESEFNSITVDSSVPIKNDSASDSLSPWEAQQKWRGEAEQNALNGLERTGLLAPAGPADKDLNAVVNNLEVTNNLDIEPEIQCRIATVDTFEMFAVGHTIVISKGLLDVIPDDATLAVLLAQEVADVMIPKPATDRFGFNNLDDIGATEAMKIYRFRDTRVESQLVDQEALKLIRDSPYADKLTNAGLFMKQLAIQAKMLPHLISPRLGNHIYLASQLAASAPALHPDQLDQFAALPIGTRIKINPWDDRAEMLPTKPVAITSPREKLPFGITPFEPILTRYKPAPPIDGESTQGQRTAGN
jgi:hypothetical protein